MADEPKTEERPAYVANGHVRVDDLATVLNAFVEQGYQVDGKFLVVAQDPFDVYFIVTGFDPIIIGAKHTRGMASLMGLGGFGGAVPGPKSP